MTNANKGIARAVWNGPFYVGPLERPVSVGDVLLKTLETIWRTILVVVGTLITVAIAIYLWVEVVGPALFPPLQTEIRAAAYFDDGTAPAPPALGAEKQVPFRCTTEFPVKTVFTNDSEKAIGQLSFSIEGRPTGRSSNVVENGSWREADTVIPPGYTWRSCWAVSTRDGFSPRDLEYSIAVLSASATDSKARLQPVAAASRPSVETGSPSPAVSPSPIPAPTVTVALGSLGEADWQKIGMGCSCSFSTGKPSKEKLIAGGDGLVFFRLDGQDNLCAAPDTQAMFDGPVSMSCGSTALQVTPTGQSTPGLDGHSSKARLTVAAAEGTASLTGTWQCGC